MKDNLKILIVGFISGLISGFFGAGGGLIVVPFLSKFMKMDAVRSRATAITIILFLVITSSFFYFRKINLDLSLVINCTIGGIIGSYIGSKLLVKFSSKVLDIIFIIFLFYSGIKML